MDAPVAAYVIATSLGLKRDPAAEESGIGWPDCERFATPGAPEVDRIDRKAQGGGDSNLDRLRPAAIRRRLVERHITSTPEVSGRADYQRVEGLARQLMQV